MNVPARAFALGAALVLCAPLQAGADTAIAPGDLLDIQVFGEPTLAQQLTVGRDGSITFPLLGRLTARGKSTTELGAEIAAGLKRYIRKPLVAVALKTEAQYNVLVLGNVKTPGRYSVPPGSRLSDALAAAGGMGPVSGPLPAARIAVGDAVRTVSLEALLRKGEAGEDVALTNGAAVYVPAPTTIHVRVLGAVDRPGEIEVNEGDRLAVAVAKAGNSVNSNADLNHIRVTRSAPGAPTQSTEVNLYRVLQQGDLSHDFVLAADDIVYVPQAYRRNGENFSGVLGVLRRLFLPF
ncbi:MAG: polysaccharide biosynthesis/export protein [Candidatus Eremiobacteraeota bacterium]|jgi:polysaccharide export outer membrane protein|nr:polysaccharide biosynthesis/export protein [Candidatus Eremiobacteraeota bacterium]